MCVWRTKVGAEGGPEAPMGGLSSLDTSRRKEGLQGVEPCSPQGPARGPRCPRHVVGAPWCGGG